MRDRRARRLHRVRIYGSQALNCVRRGSASVTASAGPIAANQPCGCVAGFDCFVMDASIIRFLRAADALSRDAGMQDGSIEVTVRQSAFLLRFGARHLFRWQDKSVFAGKALLVSVQHALAHHRCVILHAQNDAGGQVVVRSAPREFPRHVRTPVLLRGFRPVPRTRRLAVETWRGAIVGRSALRLPYQ